MPSELSPVVFRCDTASIPDFELSPEGYLRAWAKIARTGVQKYRNDDGSDRYEYRPPEEVAKIQSLKTFSEVPVSYEHPPAMLSAENAKQNTIGWTGEKVVYNGGFVETSIKIIDANAIKAILSKEKGELSAGYSCLIEMTPGVTADGEYYDCIQREIQGNHVAITGKARGGEELRLLDNRSDSSNNWQESLISFPEQRLDSQYIEVKNDEVKSMEDLEKMSKEELIALVKALNKDIEEKEDSVKKYMDSSAYYQGIVEAHQKLDGEDGESVSDKFTSRLIAEQARIKDLERRNDSANEQIESLKAEVAKLQEKTRRLDADLASEVSAKQAEIKRAKQSWLETYEACKDYLPHIDSSIVELSPVDMMRLAISNSCPSVEITSDDPTYIRGMFDLMKKGDIRNDAADAFNRNLVSAKQNDVIGTSLQEIREKQLQKKAAAWKTTN